MSSSRSRLGHAFARTRLLVGDLAVAVVMGGILHPTATLLPFRGALAVARLFGLIGTVMPWYGLGALRLMRHAFGRSLRMRDLLRLTAERRARKFCDFVVIRRQLAGKSEVRHWRLEQRNAGLLAELKKSDAPFILATGHFARQAFGPLYRTDVLPQRITSVLLPPASRSLNPRSWWLSLHYGHMLAYLSMARPDMDFVHPGQTSAYRSLVRRLNKAGNVVAVYADAPWLAGMGERYQRPFAGLEARSFATGTARLSGLTHSPIVVCIPYLKDDETVVLDWTRIIQPPRERGDHAERAVTDAILDDFERAIGQRPGQYLLECLGERRWDAQAQRWI